MFRICCDCKTIYGCKPADLEGNYDFKQATHGFCDECYQPFMSGAIDKTETETVE